MKITAIEMIPLVRELEDAFAGGTYRIVNRYTIVTRIHTDSGVVGEAFGGDEDQRQERVVSTARDHLIPLLIGEDARHPERLWQLMADARPDLGNRGIHVLDLNNHGILMQAIAAIDCALWDALGKHYGVPVATLLGGYRDRVPVIAIGGYLKEGIGPEDLRAEIHHYRDIGLSGIKLKVGRLTVDEDVDRVRIAREAAGSEWTIVCDANQAWTPDDAIEFCRKAERYHLGWMEEPVRWSDQLEGLRKVGRASSIPTNAGQGEINRYGCRDLVSVGEVGYLNVDVTIAGGVTEWRRIAGFAAHHHVKMAHHEEPQVALHLLASIPHAAFVEIFPNPKRDPMWFDLPVRQPEIVDGEMLVPDAPGLGIELNEEVIERYRGDR